MGARRYHGGAECERCIARSVGDAATTMQVGAERRWAAAFPDVVEGIPSRCCRTRDRLEGSKGLASQTGTNMNEMSSPRAPLFVVGFQRSGTTLLRLMLNAHPEIAIPHDSGELWFDYRDKSDGAYGGLASPDLAKRMIEDLLAEPRIKAWQAVLPLGELLAEPLPECFPDVMRRFHEVYARTQGKRFWGDKNTGTLVALDVLNREFPDCRIVHLVRDGRDCALSHASKEYIYGYENVLRAAVEWREQTSLCRKMGAMLPRDRFLELRYEDLILAPEAELRKVCAFLGVGYAPQMLDYHRQVDENVPAEKRGLWPLLDKPPVASNVFKWKAAMSRGDRAVFERNAGDLLKALGYETLPGPVRTGRLRELWYQVHQRIAWRLRR